MSILRTQMENRLNITVKGLLNLKLNFKTAITCLVFFFSCDNPERKPSDLLSRDEMVKILTEIYITEEKVNQMGLQRDSAEKVFERMKGRMFEKTGVPDSVFKRSFDYYVDRPKEMEMIYTALVDSLQLKEQRAPQSANPQ